MNNKHPIQPLYVDENKTVRFKSNAIVQYLLDHGLSDMNTLAALDFSQEDREQFAQLIGYSLNGFGELSYVREETYSTAMLMHETGMDEKDSRIAWFEATLAKIREGLKMIVPEIFRIHPDDLTV